MITLTSTYNLPTVILQFRDPDFNIVDSLKAEVSLRTTMTGTKRSTVIKPVTRRLTLNFKNMTRTKALEFRNFFIASKGEFVRLIDDRNRVWKIYITGDEHEITTNSLGLGEEDRKESSSITIEFDGEIISG